jgi:undecaprenyl-diphosphatase
MGALAAKGYFDLGDLIWFAVIGAIIGDNINYFIGKKYGLKIFKNGFWFIKPTHFKKGEEFFERHGSKSVFIGRFIPSIKEVIPLIAGTFGMKRLPFMVWNIFGAIGWSLIWVLPGYFFAQSLDVAKIWLTRTGFFLTVFLVIFVIFYVLKIILVKKGKEFFAFLSSVWKSIKKAIIENQEVQKITLRHKRFFVFLQKRLDKNNFYGLPLTLLSFALFYVLALFGGIIEDIINSDIIISADIRVANLLTIFRNTELTTFFFWITLLGKSKIILLFTIATISTLWLWKKRSYIIPLLISVAGSAVFTFIGKIVFHRPRPDVAIYHESSFSFPSGHATIAIAFYGFLAYLLIRNSKKWKYKINIFFASLVTILLIGFSRLYLGVHYVSDVWGGYLAGAIWLIIAISLSEYLLSRKQKKQIIHLNIKKQLATAGIIIVSIGLYIIFAFHYQIPISTQPQEISKIITNDTMTVFNSDQLKYTETLLGNRQEPLSFIIVAKNDQQLINLFKNADWTLAYDVTIFSVYKIAKAGLLKESYPQAPMTPDFWNSEVHNFGFEKETSTNNVRTRHHARFWKTNYVTENGDNIYVGTASFDSGIKWGITHKINPEIDTEREFLFKDLQKTNLLASTKKEQFVDPKLGSNFSGDLFFTDGKLYLLFIKE